MSYTADYRMWSSPPSQAGTRAGVSEDVQTGTGEANGKWHTFRRMATLEENVSMTETAPHQTVIAVRASALELIETAVSSLDQQPLQSIVEQLLTPEHEAGLSDMAVSGDEPNVFEQFLVLSEYYGLITESEMIGFARRCVSGSRNLNE